jgi:hypothetical protein
MAILYGWEGIELRDDSGVMEPVFLPGSSTAAEVDAAVNAYGFAPREDWLAFKFLAMESQDLTALMRGVSAERPQLLGWLAEALARAEVGDLGDFDRAWGLVVDGALVPAALLESFAETARSCGLPASFISLLLRQ